MSCKSQGWDIEGWGPSALATATMHKAGCHASQRIRGATSQDRLEDKSLSLGFPCATRLRRANLVLHMDGLGHRNMKQIPVSELLDIPIRRCGE